MESTIFFTLLIMLFCFIGLAIGALFGRSPLGPSCGGILDPNNPENDTCNVCGRSIGSCEEEIK